MIVPRQRDIKNGDRPFCMAGDCGRSQFLAKCKLNLCATANYTVLHFLFTFMIMLLGLEEASSIYDSNAIEETLGLVDEEESCRPLAAAPQERRGL